MANYNYDFDKMVKKMREIWTPEDFIKETERLMRLAGVYNENASSNLVQGTLVKGLDDYWCQRKTIKDF